MAAYLMSMSDEARVLVPLRDALEDVEDGVRCAVHNLLHLIQRRLHHDRGDRQHSVTTEKWPMVTLGIPRIYGIQARRVIMMVDGQLLHIHFEVKQKI